MEPIWRLPLKQMWELEFCFEEPLDFNGGNHPFFCLALISPLGGYIIYGALEGR